jgi:hypothetical protein
VEGRDALRGFIEGFLLRRGEAGGGATEFRERDAPAVSLARSNFAV